MGALSRVGLVALLLAGCSTTSPGQSVPRLDDSIASSTAHVSSGYVARQRPGPSTQSMTSACDGTFEDVVRCKALLSFPADLRAYLVDIPVSQASQVPGALAAYYFLEDRVEISPRLPDYGEAWTILTMRHEFVHALSWKMPGYREDARAKFAGLRAAITTSEAERHEFTKYDQWLRAHAEYVDDLPHFITGIVELMAPGEMPASLNSYFAPLFGATPVARLSARP